MLPLSSRRLDIWLLHTDQAQDPALIASSNAMLDDGERARTQRFYFERDRHRFLMTRALVRSTLSHYADIAPAAWRFGATAFGRPIILNAHPVAGRIVFNISHTDGLIMLGVTTGRMLGIDTEKLAPDSPDGVAESVFSVAERNARAALPIDARHQRFFDLWTLKESYMKARGMGLSIPPHLIEFTLDEPKRIGYAIAPALSDPVERWHFQQWSPTPSHRAAVCVERGPAEPLDTFAWTALPGKAALPCPHLPERVSA